MKADLVQAIKITIIFVIIFGGFGLYRNWQKTSAIGKAEEFGVAEITERTPQTIYISAQFKYCFKAGDEIFYSTRNAPLGNLTEFIGKKFPVVFNHTEPNENAILITPDDFQKYNLPFPDSLKWVSKYTW